MERVMHPSATRVAFAATLLTCAALVVAPWRGHVDDTDAQLYLVIERTMARAHEWFDLRGLPGFYPHFREHLPFAFWPGIAASVKRALSGLTAHSPKRRIAAMPGQNAKGKCSRKDG